LDWLYSPAASVNLDFFIFQQFKFIHFSNLLNCWSFWGDLQANSVAALYPKQHRWSFLFAGLKTAPTKDLRQFGRWKSFGNGTILGIKKYFNK
jgi:hypothetical protein